MIPLPLMLPEKPEHFVAYMLGQAAIHWAPSGEPVPNPKLTTEMECCWYALGMMEKMNRIASVSARHV